MKSNNNQNQNVRLGLAILGGFIFALILIPKLAITFMISPDTNETDSQIADFSGENFGLPSSTTAPASMPTVYITLYRDAIGQFQEIEFEQYLIGVVAAEMPALFAPAALQAQAIAARTYAMRILEHYDYLVDTKMHQVFFDNDQLRDRWGVDFEHHLATITAAVESTRGLVLKYNNELITPMFFAMSSGATENSEEVFTTARPYLRSVASLGYMHLDNFAVSERFTITELQEIFNDNQVTTSNIMILAHSTGGNIAEVRFGNKIYTGREVRELLGLRSASFSLVIDVVANIVTITSYGHGHGVGMSQHGANVMAQNGYSYEAILQHFYQNVVIENKQD